MGKTGRLNWDALDAEPVALGLYEVGTLCCKKLKPPAALPHNQRFGCRQDI